MLLFFSSCLLLLPLFFFIFKAAGRRSNGRRRRYNLPPGPAPLPIVGNLLKLSHPPHISLFRLSKQYGPLIYLKLGHVPAIIASSKETATEILKTQDHIFCSRPESTTGSKFTYGGLDIAFSPFNDHWKRLRKFGKAQIFSSDKVQSFRAIREEEVGILMDTIRRDSSAGKLINVNKMALCLKNNIIYRELFGKRISPDGECGWSPHHDMIMSAITLMGGFNMAELFPSFGWLDVLTGNRRRVERSFWQIDGLFEKEIEQRLKTIESHGWGGAEDFLHVLLLCQVEMDPSLGFLLSRDEIKAILLDMFLGGIISSAVTIVWGMVELMRNKSIMMKAQEEIRLVIDNSGYRRKVEENHLKDLHYLKLVINETLRLHPAAPLLGPHECMKDTKINGYDIPAKTRVIINFTTISRDPQCWVDPHIFWPERFENNNINYKGNHFEFIPFGSGRRMCPGMAFGIADVEIALANLLYTFDWRLPEGMVEEDIDMEEEFGVSVSKKAPLFLIASSVF